MVILHVCSLLMHHTWHLLTCTLVLHVHMWYLVTRTVVCIHTLHAHSVCLVQPGHMWEMVPCVAWSDFTMTTLQVLL